MRGTKGHDALWLWFGLSYASWLTLPRVLMHAMPDEWQRRMAKLLEEIEAEFEPLNFETYVSAKRDGKFVSLPDWTSRQMYRHPNKDVIASLWRKKCESNKSAQKTSSASPRLR